MSILETAQFLLFLGSVSASFTLFLDFCFAKGNILSWWLDFWLSFQEKAQRKQGRFWRLAFLAKPLGECPFCMNFWISLFVFLSGASLGGMFTAGITTGFVYYGCLVFWFFCTFSLAHNILRFSIKYINS
jgi:hypothetical protein